MTRIITAIAAATLITASAYGAEAPSGCFTRIYNRDDLGKHPDQLVTAMRLAIDAVDFWSSDSSQDFALQIKQRGNSAVLLTSGACETTRAGLRCSVRGKNHGTVRVTSVRSDARGAYIVLFVDDRIWMSDQSVEGEWFTRGKDDFDFRLYRAPKRECKGMGMERDL